MLTTKYGNGATIKSSHFVDLLIFFFSFCNCLDLAMMRQEPVIGDCLLFVYFDHFFFLSLPKDVMQDLLQPLIKWLFGVLVLNQGIIKSDGGLSGALLNWFKHKMYSKSVVEYDSQCKCSEYIYSQQCSLFL